MRTSEPPEVLYHYTTQEGLLGIITKKTLRATHVQYMNDASELATPTELVLDRLNIRKAKLDINNEAEKEIADIIDDMIFDIQVDLVYSDIGICAFSFCTDGDRLSQWRAYGSPTSSYSIGFASNDLANAVKPLWFELRPCTYLTLKEQHEKIEEMIETSLKAKLPSKVPRGFSLKFLTWASTVKDNSFREEAEWRLVSSLPKSDFPDAIDFRPGKSMLIPYCNLTLDTLPIVEIIVGPCPHPDLAKNSIENLLYKYRPTNGGQTPKVRICQVPYRNW